MNSQKEYIERFVYLNLLKGCVLNCNENIRCFSACEPNPDFDMNKYEQWIGFIEKLSDFNIRVLYFSDESILCFPHAVKLIKEAVKHVRMVRVACDPDALNNFDLIKELVASGVDAIQVRLFGSRDEVHDRYRREGSFANTLRFIEYLAKNNMECHVLAALNSDNAKDIEEIYDIAFARGVHHIALERTMQPPDYLPLKGDLLPSLDRVLERSIKEDKIVSLTDPVLFQFNRKRVHKYCVYRSLKEKVAKLPAVPRACMAGLRLVAVNADGNLSICRFIHQYIGNVFKDDFEVLLDNAASFRYEYDSKKSGSCSCCFFKDICGGCLAYASKYSDNKNTRDIFCSRLHS